MIVALMIGLAALALAMLADKPRIAGPLAGIVLLLILAAPAFAAPYIEAPPLDMPLLATAPNVRIITLPEDQIAHLDIPMCHDGSMASTVYGCVVNRGYEAAIFMPPYPSSHGGKWWSDLFFHELEGHALRGLVHYGNGRGWKAP